MTPHNLTPILVCQMSAWESSAEPTYHRTSIHVFSRREVRGLPGQAVYRTALVFACVICGSERDFGAEGV